MPKSINGRQRSWIILEQIGKGDAGEVLRVQSELARETGLVKRPVLNVSGGTILRQAMQIENEGDILEKLKGLNIRKGNLTIHTPLLLDRSIPGTSRTASLFIVSEEVKGVAIANLLKQLVQQQISFSHVLALRVLSCLFNLLEHIHRIGIVWNDVKMDHIFWDEDTATFSFIDWGNGLFIEPEKSWDPKSVQMADYQQLVSEGNLMLNQVASDLITEVDWPENANSLTELEISHLRHRIDFMENYLSMRVTEYQLAFNKSLSKLMDFEGLNQLFSLKKSLAGMGVTIDSPKLIGALTDLLVKLIHNRNFQDANKALVLTKSNLPESFGNTFQMVEYLLSLEDVYESPIYQELLIAVLAADWPKALWLLESVRKETKNLPRLISLQTAIRSYAIDNRLPLEFLFDQLKNLSDDLHLEIIKYHQSGNIQIDTLNNLDAISKKLDAIIGDWQILQPEELLGDKLLHIRELLGPLSQTSFPLPQDLLLSLNAILNSLRGIFNAWSEADLKKNRQEIKALFLLEPSMTYLTDIYLGVDKMEPWLQALKDGPAQNQSVNAFARKLLKAEPSEIQKLGKTGWLKDIEALLDTCQRATDASLLRESAAQHQWPIPWIETASIIVEIPEGLDKINLSPSEVQILSDFHHALKTNALNTNPLETIRSTLPNLFPLYKQLFQDYSDAFSTLPKRVLVLDSSAFPQQDQTNVSQVIEVITTIEDWKASHKSGLPLAKWKSPKDLSEWEILTQVQNAESLWNDVVFPIFVAFKQKTWNELAKFSSDLPAANSLMESSKYLKQLAADWSAIPERGIYSELAQEMSFLSENAQEIFFNFWKEMENSTSPMQWLAWHHQSVFSNINQSLLKMSHHFQTVSRSLKVIDDPFQARTRLAQNSAGDLMFALLQLDSSLRPPTRNVSKIQVWHSQYLKLLKLSDSQETVVEMEKMDSTHPLLPWFSELIRRDIDFEQSSENQKW